MTNPTMKDIILTYLNQEYFGIFKNRFQVLCFLFTFQENGIELDENGYLQAPDLSSMNKRSEQDAINEAFLILEESDLSEEEKQKIFQLTLIKLREKKSELELYNKTPDNCVIGELEGNIHSLPLSLFNHCKNEGLEEELTYFFNTLKNIKSLDFYQCEDEINQSRIDTWLSNLDYIKSLLPILNKH